MKESLLVMSKTRAALKAKGVNVGAGALDALNEVVHSYIDQAAKRAAANRRKTVRAHDFLVVEDEMDRPPEPPTPAESQEDEIEMVHVSGDETQIAVADVNEAVEEAAEEEPPEAWPR